MRTMEIIVVNVVDAKLNINGENFIYLIFMSNFMVFTFR